LDIPLGFSFLAASALWVLLVLVVGAEFNLLHIARSRLRQLAAAGNRSAQIADTLLRKPERLRGVARITETLLVVGIVGANTAVFLSALSFPFATLALVGLAVWLVLTLQWLPRYLGSERPWLITIAARLIMVLDAVVGPVWVCLSQRAPRPGPSRDRDSSTHRDAHEHRTLQERVADLDNITVDDIMIPRNDLASIDIADDWDEILATLRTTPHTRLPLCEHGIDNIVGIVHMKKVAHALARGELTRDTLIEIAKAREPYFTPEGTTLSDQLINFKRDRRRVAFVVDEYGDIQGLVTLEDILEEVVGEFTTTPTMLGRNVHKESEDTYVVSGGASVRELNRTLGWSLPEDGPRTLNGLIVEQLETIPRPGTTLRIGELSIEILQTAENAVRSARVRPVASTELPQLSKGVA
jgi:Mg2+/Co2+ transporter CorB